MSDLRRTVKCSNCSNEATIYVNSELDLRELLVSGKCNRCGSAMQINYSVVERPGESKPAVSETESSVNLDDALFGQDVPSDTLKDIMED